MAAPLTVAKTGSAGGVAGAAAGAGADVCAKTGAAIKVAAKAMAEIEEKRRMDKTFLVNFGASMGQVTKTGKTALRPIAVMKQLQLTLPHPATM